MAAVQQLYTLWTRQRQRHFAKAKGANARLSLKEAKHPDFSGDVRSDPAFSLKM